MADLIKILVVDDEVIVRKGIINTIDWEAIGCEIVGEASDGAEARKKCAELVPDIIITDICMNNADGISLIRVLNEDGSKASVIILSGYSDFGYAKNAMELGVRHYLLKPVENEVLIGAINELAGEIRKKGESKERHSAAKQQADLRKLLQEGGTARNFDELGIVLPEGRFVVANIKIDKDYTEDEASSLKYTNELLESVDYYSGIDIHFNLSILVGEKNVVMIIFEKNGKMGERTLLKNIRKHFNLKTGKTLTIGISRCGSDVSRVNEYYEQSCVALEKKALLGQNMLIYYDDINFCEGRFTPSFSAQEIEDMLNAAKVKDSVAARKMLHNFFEQVKSHTDVDIVSLKNTCVELAVVLLRNSVKNIEEMQLIFGRKIQPATEIVQLETIQDVENWLNNFCDKLFGYSSFMDIYKFSPLVQEVAFYIMQHYSNKMTVESLAEQFFLSEGHLMREFKKDTNMTIMEFTMQYRVYIAKNLLESKKYKIYEIAEMVGYDDTKYFSKIFKKITGKSPNQYLQNK